MQGEPVQCAQVVTSVDNAQHLVAVGIIMVLDSTSSSKESSLACN